MAEGLRYIDNGPLATELANEIISDIRSGDPKKVERAEKRIMELRIELATDKTMGFAGMVLTRLQAEDPNFELITAYPVLNEHTFKSLGNMKLFLSRIVQGSPKVLFFNRSFHAAILRDYRWYFGFNNIDKYEAQNIIEDDDLTFKQKPFAGMTYENKLGQIVLIEIDISSSACSLNEIKTMVIGLLEAVPPGCRTTDMLVYVRSVNENGKWQQGVYRLIDVGDSYMMRQVKDPNAVGDFMEAASRYSQGAINTIWCLFGSIVLLL